MMLLNPSSNRPIKAMQPKPLNNFWNHVRCLKVVLRSWEQECTNSFGMAGFEAECNRNPKLVLVALHLRSRTFEF